MADVEIISPKLIHTPHQLKAKTDDGKDLVVVSGYAEVEGTDLQGNADGTWNRKDLQFLAGPRWVTDLPQYPLAVPVVSMTSIMNVNVATNAGWAVDDCRVGFHGLVPGPGGVRVQLTCRVAVRDSDGFMFRVNFYVTIVGELHEDQDQLEPF
jgi:hypothetical protein